MRRVVLPAITLLLAGVGLTLAFTSPPGVLSLLDGAAGGAVGTSRPGTAMTQPIHFARADAPPMLLVTGTDDTTVRPRNAINLTARLHAISAPVVLKNYPGQTHEAIVMALSVPFRRKAPVLADSVAFLRIALDRRAGS